MAINNCTDVKSYTSLHTLVNDMFPPTSLVEQVGLLLALNLCKKSHVPFGVRKKSKNKKSFYFATVFVLHVIVGNIYHHQDQAGININISLEFCY